MCRSFALEYAAKNIRCNVLAIGPIAQSKTTKEDGEKLNSLLALVPSARYAEIEEVARAMKALGSDDFSFVTGQTICIDGGLSVQLRPASIERAPL